ncbi:MAG TPA: hypothetical protein VFS00_30720, partial [Polyangiaceae bacterium]|nr:hypothetical protein [Polyangiaceae bacterium]
AGERVGERRVGRRPCVDEALLRAMGTPAGTEAAGAGLSVGYALGLATRDRHGVVGRCHGGSTVGYRAMFCLFPEQGRAFFVSANTDSETADYNELEAELVRLAGVTPPPPPPPLPPPLPPPPPEARAGEADASAWAGYYVPSPNRFATFAWLDTTLGFVRVRADGPALSLLPLLSAPVPLAPAGGALFRAPGRVVASHAVLASPDGGAVISNGQQSWQRVPLTRLLPLWLSLIGGLLGLTYVLVAGLARLVTRRLAPSHPMFVPTLAALAPLLTLPLLYAQGFLRLGEKTPASVALALATASLPLAALWGLVLRRRRRSAGVVARLDALALLCVLQWALVLAAWGLLPLRLWA